MLDIQEEQDKRVAVSAAEALRDENRNVRAEYVGCIHDAIVRRDADLLRSMLSELHEADTGELLEALESEDRPQLIELLGKDFDFSALTEVDDTVREEILEELPTATVVEGVRELDSDDAVYILEDMPKEDQEEILDQLPAKDRVALERSLLYPDGSAGRRMQTEFISVPNTWTVGATIDYMRETADLPDRFYEIYVADEDGRLQGAVALDRLLRSKRPVEIVSLMDPDRRRVRATEDQREVARQFERYDLVAAPVVDDGDRLVGVLTVDDIVDVIEEEAEADIKALGGVKADEELSDSVWAIAKSRLPWLLANLLTAIVAASVIGQFQSSIEKMIALAALMPIVASLGGNAATQTMTVAVRALATRDLSSINVWRVVVRDCLVGFVNGLALAIVTGAATYAWFQVPGLSVVIGLAMVCNMVIGGLGGILIPLLFNRLRIDPAVASGVFVTTVTDVIGFFSFLGTATLWFGLK